jgi:hypothetical protein
MISVPMLGGVGFAAGLVANRHQEPLRKKLKLLRLQ